MISIPDRADALSSQLNRASNAIQSLHARATALNDTDLVVVRRRDLQTILDELDTLTKALGTDPTEPVRGAAPETTVISQASTRREAPPIEQAPAKAAPEKETRAVPHENHKGHAAHSTHTAHKR